MVTIRILIVDDFVPWRQVVRSILESNPWFRVVGEAGDGEEAIQKTTTLLPDVVLLDIGMPGLNGIQAATKIRQSYPESKIIFLTQERDSDIRWAALNTGASAYLLKSEASRQLRTTIETAMLAPAQTAGASSSSG